MNLMSYNIKQLLIYKKALSQEYAIYSLSSSIITGSYSWNTAFISVNFCLHLFPLFFFFGDTNVFQWQFKSIHNKD